MENPCAKVVLNYGDSTPPLPIIALHMSCGIVDSVGHAVDMFMKAGFFVEPQDVNIRLTPHPGTGSDAFVKYYVGFRRRIYD